MEMTEMVSFLPRRAIIPPGINSGSSPYVWDKNAKPPIYTYAYWFTIFTDYFTANYTFKLDENNNFHFISRSEIYDTINGKAAHLNKDVQYLRAISYIEQVGFYKDGH